MPVRGDHLGKMEAGIQPTCAPPSPVALDLPTGRDLDLLGLAET
ncbi:MAG: hypothetical protein Q8P67_09705 [archaeon]|nr:hypothetical protein [archaeon]